MEGTINYVWFIWSSILPLPISTSWNLRSPFSTLTHVSLRTYSRTKIQARGNSTTFSKRWKFVLLLMPLFHAFRSFYRVDECIYTSGFAYEYSLSSHSIVLPDSVRVSDGEYDKEHDASLSLSSWVVLGAEAWGIHREVEIYREKYSAYGALAWADVIFPLSVLSQRELSTRTKCCFICLRTATLLLLTRRAAVSYRYRRVFTFTSIVVCGTTWDSTPICVYASLYSHANHRETHLTENCV